MRHICLELYGLFAVMSLLFMVVTIPYSYESPESYLFRITYVDHISEIHGIIKRGLQEYPITLDFFILSGDTIYTYGDRVQIIALDGGSFRLGLNTECGCRYFPYDPDYYTLDILEGEIFAGPSTCVHLRNCGWTHNYNASYPAELRYFVTSDDLLGEVFAIKKNLTVGTYSSDGAYINLFNVTENWKLTIDGPIENCSHYFNIITPIEYEYINHTYMDNSKWTTTVGGVVIPIDRLALLAPYIGLTSTIFVVTFATAVYVKRVKHRKEKR
jgi:hypothetical protein